jgi:hypothetical protein
MEDPREAVLLKTSAFMDYNRVQQIKARQNAPGWIVIGLIAMLVWRCGIQPTLVKKQVAEVPPVIQTASTTMPADTIRSRIGRYPTPGTLVGEMRFLVTDVNGDGQLNCIDYAVTFYKHWPGARIIRNINPVTGMDHLFNKIVFNDRTMFIEPQGTCSRYYPEEVWGTKYNAYYNADQTEVWAGFAK